MRIGSGLQTDGIRYVFPRALSAESDSKLHFMTSVRSNPKNTLGRSDSIWTWSRQSLAVEFIHIAKFCPSQKQWQTIADLNGT